jgi:hypothetical protein
MSVLGAIEVQMLMDLARWQQDITNSGRMLDTGLQKMKSNISGALGGLLAGVSVAAFGGWIKGAIDAGDATKEFSQKTGVAAKDVAGLQLAFRQGGVDGDALTSSMGKLSKQMAEGNQAFKTLGISTRNTDGSLRGVMDVLYDTADAFAGVEDGAAKSALAQEIFGKSGAALIPTLNEGSEGLREMAAMADKLGLTISDETAEAADKFNDTLDLLGQSSQGMARQVAAELLPTLNGMAGALLKNMTAGDGMRKVSEGLAAAMKILFTVGALGVEIFSTAGKTIAGVAAALVAVTRGEFGQAKQILEESGRDIAKGWGNTAQTVEDAWTGAGAKSVEQMAGMTAGLKKLTPATKEQEAASKKAADELAKLTKAGKDYLDGINAQYGAMQQQISLGRELTDGEKELVKLEEKLAQGKLVLTAAERQSVEMKLREIDASKEQKRQSDEHLKTLAAVAAHSSKWNDEQAKITDGMRGANVQLIEQNDRLRLGEKAWEARERAVLLNQATDLEWQAANQGGNFQLEEQARLLRERAQLLGDGTALKEAKATADEWKRTTDSIRSGLADALMRGFESGQGFATSFADFLKNTFKTLVLKPMVDAMVADISGGLGSAMGGIGNFLGTPGASTGSDAADMKANNGGVGAGAGAASSLSWVGLVVAALKQGSSEYDAGWTAEVGARAKDNILGKDAIGQSFSKFSVDSVLTKFGKSLGMSDKWASILSGATAVAQLIGRKPAEATAQGITGSFGGGNFVGNQFVDWKAQGGWFRSDKTGTNLSGVDEALGATLGSGSRAMYEQTKAYAEALALPVQALANVTSVARIELGDDAAKNAQAIQDALTTYGAALSKDYASALDAVSQPGEEAQDTLSRLGEALLSVNTTFEALGLHLVRTSVAGGAAAAELVQLSGGLDAFLAKTQTYLGAYFSQSEQLGLGAGGVLKTLQDAGIDFSGANDRADLRALLESLDPNKAGGREQIAALLNVAGDFAKLTDYLAENNLTLGQLAAQAPALGLLVDDPATRSATAGEQSAALLQTSNDRLNDIAGATQNSAAQLQALVALQAAANQALLAQLQSLQQATEDAARLADLAPVYVETSTGA